MLYFKIKFKNQVNNFNHKGNFALIIQLNKKILRVYKNLEANPQLISLICNYYYYYLIFVLVLPQMINLLIKKQEKLIKLLTRFLIVKSKKSHLNIYR